MALKNITLELSSKPFRDDSDGTLYAVCRKMFSQWKNLTDAADRVSVMLWIADGSEILEYGGNLSEKFEWAYWCGVANAVPHPEGRTQRQMRSTHQFPSKYFPEAGPRPYSWIKRLIEVLRETGKEITGREIRIGATFDNGPEFAISKFKYHTHPEIAAGNTMYKNSNVVCNSILHADNIHYAAFPDGIPEGTTLGHFLGAQFKCFAKDFGFDYIWLSNGMGFGRETWGVTGALFDKHEWHPEYADKASETMLNFWNDFTSACPGVDIETRGSNFSAGTEISTDAAPLKELYAEKVIAPPVNSPWAALNFQSGLEIAAWMSHIAELPDDRIPFRFYTHDPWFMNSPWLDRYGRRPWDIYQPLSVARLNGKGEVQSANTISILSVDDTMGRMPDKVPREVIPHLLAAAEDEAPDAPGPLLWIYPFDEYSEMTRGKKRRPDIVFAEDQYIGEAIQGGLPLNTVISTGNFRKLMKAAPKPLEGILKVVPVSAWESVEPHLNACGNILFYGTLENAPEKLRDLLGAGKSASPLTGETSIETFFMEDEYVHGKLPETCHIQPQFLGGGITETVRNEKNIKLLATLRKGSEKRAVAWICTMNDGRKIGFLRCLLSLDPKISDDRNLNILPASQVFPVESIARMILPEFGWTLQCHAQEAGTELPRTNISRHDNAFFYSVFARDTTCSINLGTPLGAPVANEMESVVVQNSARWNPDKFDRYECRCFAKQKEESVVSCKIGTVEYPTNYGRLIYSGFKNAEVRFFPPEKTGKYFEVVHSKEFIYTWTLLDHTPEKLEWETTPFGKCIVLRNITGHLYFSW